MTCPTFSIKAHSALYSDTSCTATWKHGDAETQLEFTSSLDAFKTNRLVERAYQAGINAGEARVKAAALAALNEYRSVLC